jgi:hypothetical protein
VAQPGDGRGVPLVVRDPGRIQLPHQRRERRVAGAGDRDPPVVAGAGEDAVRRERRVVVAARAALAAVEGVLQHVEREVVQHLGAQVGQDHRGERAVPANHGQQRCPPVTGHVSWLLSRTSGQSMANG